MAAQNLHFVLVTFMAPGHMVPMIEMAQLLAERGALVSVITTPVNAARIKNSIDRIATTGLPVRFIELRFPCAEAGLPDGCECADLIPLPHLVPNFFQATSMLKQPLKSHLLDHQPDPSCIIADVCHPWTTEVASELGIPRLVFQVTSCFAHLCYRNIRRHGIYDDASKATSTISVPDMPQQIEVNLALSPDMFGMRPELRQRMVAAVMEADGLVLNSFDELEPWILERYREATGKMVWTIGPLPLVNKDNASKAARGNMPTVDVNECLTWLDAMSDRSVIYVAFGSLTRIRPSQVIEIGCGLEASGHPFVWVIKDTEKAPEVEEWLSNGFEERMRGRGLVIHGWSPQATILSHRAIGGAVTQCGWNSVLESVNAGLPMLTWPHFFEQFLNETLVVEVLRIGVAIGAKTRIFYSDESAVLKRDVVERGVRRLMDTGEEGKERRARVMELGEKARKAMEVGGSSYVSATCLIEYISQFAKKDVHLEG